MKVSILVFEGTIALPSIGSLELLAKSGRISPPSPFHIELVAVAGRDVRTAEGLVIRCHRTIAEVESTDLVLIPALDGDVLAQLDMVSGCVPWVREMYGCGAEIASICTGAFVLAETGLLDGRRATTHWSACDLFTRRYPAVQLQPEQIIVDEGRIITCGGATTFLNLIMYLVEKYCGREPAVLAAKRFLIDLDKGPQTAYAIFSTQKRHGDEVVLRAQHRIEDLLPNSVSVTHLADELGVSRRSLERRFKNATGNTVLRYTQRLRMEAAKKLLESSTETVTVIAESVGYEDPPSFRKLFVRTTGMTPAAYRRRYGRSAMAASQTPTASA